MEDWNPEDEENIEPQVDVDFDIEWNSKNRFEKLIEGAELSVDEIIKSLHQPMKLYKLQDEKYKIATAGREDAINTASAILTNIDLLKKKLDRMNEDGEIDDEKKDEGSWAEKNASDSSV